MEKTKKGFTRVAVVVVALVLAVASCAGAAWAVLSSVSETTENSLSAGLVACQVEEEFDGVTKEAVAVRNTGTATSYARVRLVTYWVDESGSPVGMAAPELDVVPADGWSLGKDGCYYASCALAPGAVTPNLLGKPVVLAQSGTCRQVVEVLAEVIQAQPADAAAEAWGAAVSGGELVPLT